MMRKNYFVFCAQSAIFIMSLDKRVVRKKKVREKLASNLSFLLGLNGIQEDSKLLEFPFVGRPF